VGITLPLSLIFLHPPKVHDQSEACHGVSDQLARPDHVILVGEIDGSVVDLQEVKQLKCFALRFPILSQQSSFSLFWKVPKLRNCDVVFLPLFSCVSESACIKNENKTGTTLLSHLLLANRVRHGLFFFSHFDFDFGIFVQSLGTPNFLRNAACVAADCVNVTLRENLQQRNAFCNLLERASAPASRLPPAEVRGEINRVEQRIKMHACNDRFRGWIESTFKGSPLFLHEFVTALIRSQSLVSVSNMTETHSSPVATLGRLDLSTISWLFPGSSLQSQLQRTSVQNRGMVNCAKLCVRWFETHDRFLILLFKENSVAFSK
jgi:hypothetical protein